MKSETADMPKRATVGSAAYDFYAPYDIDIKPGEWTVIDTGVRFENEMTVTFDNAINTDWCMLIMPRSGMGMKYGFRFKNTIGLIDKDYRGPIMATVTADEAFSIKAGERIFQGLIVPFGRFVNEVAPEAVRTGGMGSTGQ